MKKLIDFVVEKRYIFMIFFFLLMIGSIFLIPHVKTNYDTTKYLEDGSNTKITYDIMNSEFSSNGSFQIMIAKTNENEALEVKKQLSGIKGISSVLFDETDYQYYHDGYALFAVFLNDSNFTDEARDVVIECKELLKDKETYMNGGAIESLYLSDSVNSDMASIMIVACIVVFLILLLNSVSWIEPVIFMIVIAVAIFINLGTNAILSEISFITKSICAIMQLALAMDYSIMLLHRYIDEQEKHLDLSSKEVVKIALKETIMPILGSGLTTVAGLLALACMKFKMGFDIGLVLAKGIIISMIVVFFFMSGLLVVFSKLIMKTKHRNIYQIIKGKFPKFENRIARFQFKSKVIIPIILVCLIVVGFIFYTKASYAYTLEASSDPNSQINIDNNQIQKNFGYQNSVAILVEKGNIEEEKRMAEFLMNYTYQGKKVFSSVQGISTIGIYDYFTSEELSTNYGIQKDLIDLVFQKIDAEANSETKLQLIEVLYYLQENNFITSYSATLQNEYNDLYEKSKLVEEIVTKESLVSMIKDLSDVDYSEKNASSLLELVSYRLGKTNFTYGEMINVIADNKELTTILNDYKEFTTIYDKLSNSYNKEQIVELLPLSEQELTIIYRSNTTLTLRKVIERIEEEGLINNLSNPSKIYFYQAVKDDGDKVLTKEEVKNYSKYCYPIFPDALLNTVYLLSSQLTNYQIQKRIISTSQIVTLITNLENKLIELNSKLPMLKTVYNKSSMALEFGFKEEYVEKIFVDSNKNELLGSEILKYVSEDNYLNVMGSSIKESFEQIIDQIEYAKKMFEGEKYSRLVLNMNYSRSSNESMEVSKALRTDLNDFYDEYYVVSESSAFVDFEETFSTDSLKINLISFLFILIIIAISFKSLLIPVILTVIIQGAIWLTMTFNVWEGSSVYFICYLMVVCIQMGTTIDYGILYTSKYIEERKKHNKIESLEIAFQSSITTILTSGSILVIAAFLVGKISQVSIISSIGYLLSKGSLISVLFILFALPQVLLICDKIIQKTTIGYKPFEEKEIK